MTLPSGWQWASLEEVIGEDAPIVYGIIQAGPEAPNGVPYIRPTELVDGRIDVSALKRTSPSIAAKYARSTLKAGDIVLAIVGTIGKLAIVPPELEGANITQSSARLRPPSYMPPGYLAAVLQSPQLRAQFDQMEFGVAVRRLNIAHVRALRIPVAPASEQRRIVAKLDRILEQTRTVKTRLERLPALLDKFKSALLAAAFRGDLTADWRSVHPEVEPASAVLERIRIERLARCETAVRAKGKDPTKAKYETARGIDVDNGDSEDRLEVPSGWAWATIESIATDIVDCPHSTPRYNEGDCFALDTTCMSFEGVAISKLRRLSEESFRDRTRRLVPQPGDVVFAREGSVGTAVVVPAAPPICLGQRVMLVRPASGVSPRYLAWVLMSPQVRAQYAPMLAGTTVPHVNVGDIRRFRLPIPPVDEQNLLVERLHAALASVSTLETIASRTHEGVEGIETAALEKAFRGELAEQDPSDEPASLTLERVHQERGSSGEASLSRSNTSSGAKRTQSTQSAARQARRARRRPDEAEG